MTNSIIYGYWSEQIVPKVNGFVQPILGWLCSLQCRDPLLLAIVDKHHLLWFSSMELKVWKGRLKLVIKTNLNQFINVDMTYDGSFKENFRYDSLENYQWFR